MNNSDDCSPSERECHRLLDMALWQVSFAVIPNQHFEESGRIDARRLVELMEGNESAYADFALPADYREQIGILIPPGEPWSPDMELWGGVKSDDFTIWRDEGKINAIEVRLDVRKLDDVLISGILLLAQSWGCTLVEKKHHTVCRLTAPELRRLIAGHGHSRAMREPAVWLPFIAEQVRRDEGA